MEIEIKKEKKMTKLMLGDNIQLLKKLPDNSIDSCVTDGPYGLSFMNKKWDYDVPSVEFWKEVYRVLKPGGHILSFGGTKTYHRMVVNIEDAGFEIRDQIMWLYGSGFPKSHNIGKAVDKMQGNEREYIGEINDGRKGNNRGWKKSYVGEEGTGTQQYTQITKGQSDWEGWGTALKPANEPICLARKPLSKKSVAENVLKWRTGAINIDDCRLKSGNEQHNEGRFPANIILDEIAGEILDEQSGVSKSRKRKNPSTRKDTSTLFNGIGVVNTGEGEYNDKGGASRFFYQAKVSKKERNMGLDLINSHPTVKPVSLMAYLCRLITPLNGIILDPFMGSGSTGIAAQLEGFRFVGMEMDKGYFKIAETRIENYEKYREFIK